MSRDWHGYFYHCFPEELKMWLQENIPEHNCPHTEAPFERRCLINRSFHRQKEARFRFTWYGVTLCEQGLHRYFPEGYERWLECFGGFPLPVQKIGFGCVRVAAPVSLLAESDRLAGWSDYVSFWIGEMREKFEAATGVTPRRFVEAIMHNPQFMRNDNHFEVELLETALREF